MQEITITGARNLLPDDQEAVVALFAAARERDGADYPAQAPGTPVDAPSDVVSFLLARQGPQLVGFAHLSAFQEIEATVLIHPDHRRRGIGRELAGAIGAETVRRGRENWLLTCDIAKPGGTQFAVALGGVREFAEHRLRLDPARLPPPAPSASLACRIATPADTATIAAIVSAAFGDPLAEVRDWVSADFRHTDRRWFVAELAQATIGTLRLREVAHEGTYVTGFGIAPAYQNQRLGRQFLLTILAQLRAEGHPTILIEVETDNAPANALYRAVGFDPIHTFEYYRFRV